MFCHLLPASARRLFLRLPIAAPLLALTLALTPAGAQTPAATPRLRSGEPIPQSVLDKVAEVTGKSAAVDPQASAAMEQALRWKFNADSRTRRVVYRQTLSLEGSLANGKQVREERERGFTQREKVQRLPQGWSIAATVLHNEAFRNGVAADDPLATALNGKTMTLHLNAAGEVTGVEGAEQAIAAIRRELDPGTFARLESQLTPEMLLERAKSQFNARYEDLRGRPLLEDAWVVRGWGYRSPVGQEIRGVAAVTLEGYEELHGVRCARVRSAVGATPADLSDPNARAAAERFYRAAGHGPSLPTGTISGSTLYWFEVETGLLQRVRRDFEGVSRRHRAGGSESIRYRIHEETDFQ